ncbi:hypothetical protein HY573_01595 [Candidatus Parcubacteria bacterium]|nr:hypothetical protein [Candidatus Parcubacteria bacterium]
MDQSKQRHLFILIGIGALAIVVFGVIISSLLQLPPQATPPAPGAGAAANANILPPDLKVFSGRVTEKSESGMIVEWSVPKTTDLRTFQILIKHVHWSDKTLFDRLRPGVSDREAIASGELKVGDTVQVSTVETVQDHYELTAVQVRILLPPEK